MTRFVPGYAFETSHPVGQKRTRALSSENKKDRIDLIILLNEEPTGTSVMPTRDMADSSSSRTDMTRMCLRWRSEYACDDNMNYTYLTNNIESNNADERNHCPSCHTVTPRLTLVALFHPFSCFHAAV